MFRMNDLIAQINYFTENEKTLKKYYQKVLKAVEVTKQFCDAQKTLYQRSIKIADPFYEYRKSLMEALSVIIIFKNNLYPVFKTELMQVCSQIWLHYSAPITNKKNLLGVKYVKS